MTGSSSDETVPHQVVIETVVIETDVSGPQTVDETDSEQPSSLLPTRYTYVPLGDPSQGRLPSSHQYHPQSLSLQRGPHNEGPGQGAEETAPPTAAMSVASLDDEPKSAARMERENFLLFIKILFKILEEDSDTTVRSRAQRIVMECRRRNQQGDPNYTPLMNGIERHLRVFVGEAKWRRSHLLLHHYISTRRGMPGSSPNSTNRERPTAIMVGK